MTRWWSRLPRAEKLAVVLGVVLFAWAFHDMAHLLPLPWPVGLAPPVDRPIGTWIFGLLEVVFFLPFIIYIFIAIAWVALMALHDVILPWIYREGKYAPPPIEIASALRPTHLPG